MNKSYFFNQQTYLRWTISKGADNGYPKPLSAWHPFLENGVDAAVNWGIVGGRAKAYFFKGNQYLRWSIGKGADAGYPKPLSAWHPFLANGVDAAVSWGVVNGKRKVYFFKGNQYLRWTIGEGADAGYPKPLADFHPFLANGVDAAVNWGIVNGKPKAYFFTNGQYLRWTIGEGPDSGYPKPLSAWHAYLNGGVRAAVNWSKNLGNLFRYFRVSYSGHSNTNAYLLAALSHLIYSGNGFGHGNLEERFRHTVQNLSAGEPFAVQMFDSAGATGFDTQTAVLTNSKLTLVVFRGSEANITDWVNDFTIMLKSTPSSWGAGVRVHKGFADALHTVYLQIKQAIIDNGKPVYITGHSLGGALATLCAYRLRKVDSLSVSGIYTFGAPRVGDLAFKTAYNDLLFDRTYRWVNKNDAAPQVPNYGPGLAGLPTSYHHVGQLNYIPKNGVVMMNANDFEPLLSNGEDHKMLHYYNKMLARLSNESRSEVNNPSYLVHADAPDLI